ncbi:gamma-aminobutyric acid type B receptor subunit 2-like [Montipora capricornis]|uniref:gamma-aminobutyric acid type B receptor subunit 2-like n=1 Tax=Montipora capricornis TaxID=246305 RepID=UPI0035F1A2A7
MCYPQSTAIILGVCLAQGIVVLSAANSRHDSQIQKRQLYIGSMAPVSGKRAWWGGGIPLAFQMAFEDINKRNDVLGAYNLKLVGSDTQGDTGLGNKRFYNFLQKKQVRLILGPSRSNVAESAGATAKHYNMIQVSPSAASGQLSDKSVFPYFFRTVPALSAANRSFIAIAKTFKWTRVAILYQSRELFISAAASLRAECLKNGIHVISYGSFSSDPKSQIQHLKAIDARIVFGFFSKSTEIMCEIYKQRMYGSKYAWVIHTPDSPGWWNRKFKNLNCTAEEVNKAANGIVHINYMWLSCSKRVTVAGMTPYEYQSRYIQRAQQANVNATAYNGFAYDAAWLIALALNRTAQKMGPHVFLNTLPFGNKTFSDLVKESLLETQFIGVTSMVKLNEKGDRLGVFEISQLKGTEFEAKCSHDVTNSSLKYYPEMKFEWQGGNPPKDRQGKRNDLITMPKTMFIFMCVSGSLGICLAFALLCFNVRNRNIRLIKMSSPNLNNATIVGCILSYISAILYAFDGNHVTDQLCKARVSTLCFGFTIAFGPLFSKTWRVHKITRIMSAKKMAIRDVHLFGVVGVLLAMDMVILLTWNFLDPLKRKTTFLASYYDEKDDNMLYLPYVYTCEVNNMMIWLGILYPYKGILLLFGLFLAWETRNVKIPALNDSHHIGVAVYNVVIVCIVGTPVVLFVQPYQFETAFMVTAICIFFCTTSTMCIVFIPKIAALRKCDSKDPKIGTRTFASLEHYSAADLANYNASTFDKEREMKQLEALLKVLQMEKEKIIENDSAYATKL